MYCSEDLYNLFFSSENTEEEEEKLKQLVEDITQIFAKGAKKFGAWSYGRGDPPNDLEKTFLIFYQNESSLLDDKSSPSSCNARSSPT